MRAGYVTGVTGGRTPVRRSIRSVRTFRLKLEAGEPYLGTAPEEGANREYFVRPPWRSLYSHRFETLLVRVEESDGEVGWGEALAPVGPEVAQLIVDRLLAPRLLGANPRDPRPLVKELAGLMRERGHLVGHQADAIAACDIALHDLAARMAGVSVAELLGGAFRHTLPVYVSGLPRPSDAGRVELARQWATKGVGRIKLALGYGVEPDIATYDAIAAACPGAALAIDAHWAYSLADAERLGRALDERGGWFLEAPLAPEDVEGHRHLANRITTPVAIGETLRNRFEFADWLVRDAVDLCQPDVARTGIVEAQAAATLASTRHRNVAPHHSVGLGVALAAGLQFAAATENLEAFEYQPSTLPHANRILSTPLETNGSTFDLPEGPGLGVAVDEDAVIALSEQTSQ
jgi:galactonate dehydratase